MKKLVVVLFCFFASNAFASSADSGKCPWKMPLTIKINAVGNAHRYAYSMTERIDRDTDFGIQPSSTNLNIVVDTTADRFNFPSFDYNYSIQYSLTDDVLNLTVGIQPNKGGYPIYQFTSLTILFASGTDSIISLSYSEVDSTSVEPPISVQRDNFQISSLLFNDTSIYTTDSSMISHNIAMTGNDINGSDYGSYGFDRDYTDFTASSVTLSGIFRPTTFSDPPSIVTETPQPNNLAIYSSNGSVACSFDVADHARDLEIFSPLGIREAGFTVSPGQTEASLPHLPDGFYFVRLGGSLKKIYVAE